MSVLLRKNCPFITKQPNQAQSPLYASKLSQHVLFQIKLNWYKGCLTHVTFVARLLTVNVVFILIVCVEYIGNVANTHLVVAPFRPMVPVSTYGWNKPLRSIDFYLYSLAFCCYVDCCILPSNGSHKHWTNCVRFKFSNSLVQWIQHLYVCKYVFVSLCNVTVVVCVIGEIFLDWFDLNLFYWRFLSLLLFVKNWINWTGFEFFR